MMMPDLGDMIVTALKLALALSIIEAAAFLVWLAWCLRCIALEDAHAWQEAREALSATLPSDATVEVCGEVFTVEEVRWLAKLQSRWHNEPVEVR